MYDLLIKNGTVVSPTASAVQDIAVSGEVIAAIEAPGVLPESDAIKVIDATGCLVIPGGVDPHVHYKMAFEPVVTEGPEYSEAAAWGGTTTVVDFAFHEPPSSVAESVDAKKADFEGQMAVDWGLHVIMTKNFGHEDIEQLGDIIRGGIPTIKTMMTYGYQSDDGQRFAMMREVARNGGMSMVHAEDDAIANWLTAEYVRAGKVHGAYICETRGPVVEEAAVRRALFLAERAESPLYILHMAAGSAVRALGEYRARGLPMYGETLSAYLSFCQDNLWDDSPVQENGETFIGRGLLYNNYPPFKFREDRDELWRALGEGVLSAVGTDHAAIKIKDRFELMGTTLDTFVQAGQTAAEIRVPMLYQEGVVGGRISVNRWVETVATAPAKMMGLWPRKGELLVGSDADIVVFDPARTWTVDWRDLHGSMQYNLWDGVEVNGNVRTTILRGSVLVESEQWVGSKVGGQFLRRAMLPQVAGSELDLDFTRQSV